MSKSSKTPSVKISKSSISSPISVTHVASFRNANGPLLSPKSPKKEFIVPSDSGINLPETTNAPAITPFSGRFDASASIAGSPFDPRMQNREPAKLNVQQFQNFIQAVGAFRRQLIAMSAAAETFVRSLEDLSEFVPAADIKNADDIGDLEFLIDSTHLIANSHQIWAETVEKEFETPLVHHLAANLEQAKKTVKENKEKITKTVALLQQEEDASYKMGKQKKRDFTQLEKSLQVRTALADQIKSLQTENLTLNDTLSHNSMGFILERCSAGMRAELETYDRIMEGLKKLGAYQGDPDHDTTFPTTQRRRSDTSVYTASLAPPTEILPPVSRMQPPMRLQSRGGGLLRESSIRRQHQSKEKEKDEENIEELMQFDYLAKGF